MTYFIETKNLKLVNHKTLVATMTISINGEMDINNCKLVYSDKAKSYQALLSKYPIHIYQDKEVSIFPIG